MGTCVGYATGAMGCTCHKTMSGPMLITQCWCSEAFESTQETHHHWWTPPILFPGTAPQLLFWGIVFWTNTELLRRISLALHAALLASKANSVVTVPPRRTKNETKSERYEREAQWQIQGRCLRGNMRNDEHLCAGHVHDCANCGESSRMCQYHAVLGIFCSEKCMADQIGIRRSSIVADNTPWVDADWHGGPRCQS